MKREELVHEQRVVFYNRPNRDDFGSSWEVMSVADDGTVMLGGPGPFESCTSARPEELEPYLGIIPADVVPIQGSEPRMCPVLGFGDLTMDAVRAWLDVEHARAMQAADLPRAHYVNAARNDEPGELEAILHGRESPGLQGGQVKRRSMPTL